MNAASIVELLTGRLCDDARVLLDIGDVGEYRIHAQLHDRIGAVGRALRLLRSGAPVHAAACVMPDGRGMLATAPSGFGKSTLVSLLGTRLLASFVSDDTVWVGARVARGFGAPFAVRPESPFYANASELWYARGDERLLVQPADLGIAVADSCTVDVLLFPTFGDGPPVCEAMLPVQAFAQLVMSLLRPINDTDLTVLADLAAACRAGAIRYPDSETCLDLVKQVCAMEPPEISSAGLVGRDELDGSGFLPSVGAMRFDDAVAVWNSVSGTVVCVDGWRQGEKLARGDAFDQLRDLGYTSVSAAGL